jgi:cyclase
VRSVADAERLLRAGADKVAVNSAAVADPGLLSRLAQRFGSQCVVLSIDARRVGTAAAGGRPGGPVADAQPVPTLRHPERSEGSGRGAGPIDSLGPWSFDATGRAGFWEVVTHGGRRPTGRCALAWLREGVERGAGEVLLTSIDGDGTRAGYDLALLAAAARAVPVPVIASGGAGHAGHLAEALAAGAAAVLAASIFHRGTTTVAAVKAELAAAGFPVRPALPEGGL